MRLSVNQITTSNLGMAEAVDLYARSGVAGISLWEDRVRDFGLERTRALVRDAGLVVSGFCLVGLFSRGGRAARGARLEAARASIDLAAALGAPSAVTVVGGLLPETKDIADARRYCFDALAEVCDHARAAGLPLALEPLHPMYAPDWSVLNTLAQANDWCDRLGAGVGVAIDTYHSWWDPDLEAGIRAAGDGGRLLTVHVNDWLMETESLLLDRGLPGEGVINLPWFIDRLRAAGYDDWIEVEIFSNKLWAGDQARLVADIVARTEPLIRGRR